MVEIRSIKEILANDKKGPKINIISLGGNEGVSDDQGVVHMVGIPGKDGLVSFGKMKPLRRDDDKTPHQG